MVDKYEEAIGLYREFDPYVRKVFFVLKKLFFANILPSYKITSEFLYPKAEHLIANWQIRRRSERLYTEKERIMIRLGFNSLSGKPYFSAEVVKGKPILRGYEKYSVSAVSKNDSFPFISKILLKLVFDAYIENYLFFRH
jgi:hypothetical protein